MRLNAYSAQKRMAVFEELRAGRDPSEGSYDASLWREAKVKGPPQMGLTRYSPDSIVFEFIFPDNAGGTIVMPVTIPAPERIVFMPVPSWVVETIWQGEIDGSYHFESDARTLLSEFSRLVEDEANAELFGAQRLTGKGRS